MRNFEVEGGKDLHRNSQKRIYIEEAVYFITTRTLKRYPYFTEDVFCELFVEYLLFTQKLKPFRLYVYKINPEHIHLLIQPNDRFNFSEIIRSLKTNFSRNANRIMGYNNDLSKVRSSDLAFGIDKSDLIQNHVLKYKKRFLKKYEIEHHFPKYKWQKSFYDHVIRNHVDFISHINYIQNQWIKHKLSVNKYLFIDEELCNET